MANNKRPVAKKKAVKRKPASPARPAHVPHVTNPKNKRKIPLDFTTSRNLEEGDHRIPRESSQVVFLVDDVDGNEHLYMCARGQVPAEARPHLAEQ